MNPEQLSLIPGPGDTLEVEPPRLAETIGELERLGLYASGIDRPTPRRWTYRLTIARLPAGESCKVPTQADHET